MERNVVLVVEDDPVIQNFFSEAVMQLLPGFHVQVFAKENPTCEFVREHEQEIFCAILDGNITHGKGWVVAKCLREEMKSVVPIYYCGETELPNEFEPYMTDRMEKHGVIKKISDSLMSPA